MNSYSIVSKVMESLNHPNVDMLIIKPSLFCYIKREYADHAKNNTIKTDDQNILRCYFTRVPENLESYSSFLNEHCPVKIAINKLEKIKNQQVRMIPVNIPGFEKDLTKNDILELVKKNSYFFKFFETQSDISKIPHVGLWLESGVLPSFTYKVIE